VRTFRIVLHSLVLTLSNFAGILIGFVAFRAVGATDQIAVQLPVAAACSILLFLGLTVLMLARPFKRLAIGRRQEFALVFLGSLAWNPVVFVPLHYATQGYLTGAGNIVAVLFFQLPANALAVALAWGLINAGGRSGQAPGAPGSVAESR
jgi:hypothetical protein